MNNNWSLITLDKGNLHLLKNKNKNKRKSKKIKNLSKNMIKASSEEYLGIFTIINFPLSLELSSHSSMDSSILFSASSFPESSTLSLNLAVLVKLEKIKEETMPMLPVLPFFSSQQEPLFSSSSETFSLISLDNK